MKHNTVIINGIKKKIIPLGYCACGCGGKTKIAIQTDPKRQMFKGQHNRFISGGHSSRTDSKKYRRNYELIYAPNHHRANDGYVRKHLLMAEKALGKPITKNIIVHHHSEDQLVICENQSYHMLLHQRMRAYKACGQANWRKCCICKTWDDPKNLKFNSSSSSGAHSDCSNKYKLNRKRIRLERKG